ncbi:MAG: hypothetical protein WDN08_18200 [Rhizomicrobium sp.]
MPPRLEAARLAAIPKVGMTVTLNDFVPDDQEKKLALIADAGGLLDPVINPFLGQGPAERRADRREPARDGEGAARRRQGRQDGGGHRGAQAGRCAGQAGGRQRRLAGAGERGAGAWAQHHAVPDGVVIAGVAVTVATMPPEMVRDWVAKDGTARIQVFPKDTSGTNAALNAFSKAVMKVAPDATGAPISIRQSGTTIVDAFVQAGVLSFVVITAAAPVGAAQAARRDADDHPAAC